MISKKFLSYQLVDDKDKNKKKLSEPFSLQEYKLKVKIIIF